MTELTLAEALQRGILAHRSSNIKKANRFYSVVLKVQPDHPDANPQFGRDSGKLNKANKALPFFKKALDVKPSVAQYWLSYIDTLIKLKGLKKARIDLKHAQENVGKGDIFAKLEERPFIDQRDARIVDLKSSAESQKDVAETESLEEIIGYIVELRETDKLDEAIKVGLGSLKGIKQMQPKS